MKKIIISTSWTRGWRRMQIKMTPFYYQQVSSEIDPLTRCGKLLRKVLEINLKSKKTNIISMGHRNIQGLYYSKKFDFIISTEHGPKGGDEVNINHRPSKKIKNFGWPISSYGEHYYKNHSEKILNEAPLNKSHKKFGFEEPIKYFVPSIGISEIISLNNNDNEFLLGAMGSEIVEQDLGLHYIKLNDKKKK